MTDSAAKFCPYCGQPDSNHTSDCVAWEPPLCDGCDSEPDVIGCQLCHDAGKPNAAERRARLDEAREAMEHAD